MQLTGRAGVYWEVVGGMHGRRGTGALCRALQEGRGRHMNETEGKMVRKASVV